MEEKLKLIRCGVLNTFSPLPPSPKKEKRRNSNFQIMDEVDEQQRTRFETIAPSGYLPEGEQGKFQDLGRPLLFLFIIIGIWQPTPNRWRHNIAKYRRWYYLRCFGVSVLFSFFILLVNNLISVVKNNGPVSVNPVTGEVMPPILQVLGWLYGLGFIMVIGVTIPVFAQAELRGAGARKSEMGGSEEGDQQLRIIQEVEEGKTTTATASDEQASTTITTTHSPDEIRLLKQPTVSGRVQDVFHPLHRLSRTQVQSLGFRGTVLIFLTCIVVTPLQIFVSKLNSLWEPWYLFQGFFRLSFVTLCLATCMVAAGIAVLLLRQAMINFADSAKEKIESVIATGASRLQSLDSIARERYYREILVARTGTRLQFYFLPTVFFGSATVYGLIYAILSRKFEVYSGAKFGMEGAALGILFIVMLTLVLLAMVASADTLLLESLLEIRSRFPCRSDGKDWRDAYLPIREDIDSLIQLCTNRPIGFRVAGLLISVPIVKAIAYAVVSTIPIVIQAASKESV